MTISALTSLPPIVPLPVPTDPHARRPMECPVCWESLAAESLASVSIPCGTCPAHRRRRPRSQTRRRPGHIFHEKCLWSCIQQQVHPTADRTTQGSQPDCPTCRKPLNLRASTPALPEPSPVTDRGPGPVPQRPRRYGTASQRSCARTSTPSSARCSSTACPWTPTSRPRRRRSCSGCASGRGRSRRRAARRRARSRACARASRRSRCARASCSTSWTRRRSASWRRPRTHSGARGRRGTGTGTGTGTGCSGARGAGACRTPSQRATTG